MEKEVTIYDIARIMSLSAATVSRALNNHPAINIKTRNAVTAKANELGYRSNTFASSLRRKSTKALGVIVPRLNSHFMSSVLAGMETVANKAGYNLLISQSLESVHHEKGNTRAMYNSRVDGLMVSVAYDTETFEHFDNFLKKGVPVLFFDRTIEVPGFPGIVIDNEKGGYDATMHLISQGCRKIMHVAGNLARNVYRGRYDGYRKALAEKGLEFAESLLIINDLSPESGGAVADYIDKMENKPDGIFLANDICAIGCMKALKQKSFAIPGDIAIAGFNNDPVSEVIEPNLTTINYPGRQMGEWAVSAMISHLNGSKPFDATQTMVLRSELLIRDPSLRNQI
ncbi:Catabolite control protein A [Dyadobacter sp. CECT 9275]|uniref:Catabolite control protein A n=1 Tax=Dyadobacter helix TaxID=2822344 RepID=A0A916J8W6_9BACT|nr:LacI family DNA-binding transcriptional regulator [Dyadobacter sp. CECT 9275]CAG4988845.1 Catabolite control protein A [Dyadobacter sp. CECT 9275]